MPVARDVHAVAQQQTTLSFMMNLKLLPAWLRITIDAVKKWNDDGAFKHSAAIAFYTLFSLAPITIVALAITGFFFGGDAAGTQFIHQVSELIGQQGATLLQEAAQISEPQHDGWASTVISVGVLLVAATTVFAQLQQSLNEIWSVRSRPERRGWVVLVIRRLISFAMVLTLGFLLLVSLALTTMLSVFVGFIETRFAVTPFMLHSADMVMAFAVITVLFVLFFKVMPDVKLPWSDAWRGAVVTSLLFTVGRYAIAAYLSHSNLTTVYGGAGSLVALLIWVYYSCAILFFGAEFIRAHREFHDKPTQPKSKAVLVKTVIVESTS